MPKMDSLESIVPIRRDNEERPDVGLNSGFVDMLKMSRDFGAP
jgi:hypothetical protein